MSRGPDASQLWMMGGLPTFREFKINTGIEALKEVWDRLPELKTKGRGGIQKILADHWKGKFSEDNSAIIANGIWSCILLHGDKSEESLPGTDRRAIEAKATEAPAENQQTEVDVRETTESGFPKTVDEWKRCDKKKRQTIIDNFIAKVTDAKRKITRKDISTVAGYKTTTDFERFQRCDRRSTKNAEDNFTRVLNMNPDDFIKSLESKQKEK